MSEDLKEEWQIMAGGQNNIIDVITNNFVCNCWGEIIRGKRMVGKAS